MSTITTKQLRDNMAEVIRNLEKGQSVQLSYRHKVIGTLQPAKTAAAPERRGAPQTVQAYLERADFGPIPQKLQASPQGFKQQLDELRKQELLP